MKRIISAIYIVITLTGSNISAENGRPIVLVHGILSDSYSMQPIVKLIQKYLPGRYVRNIEIGLGKFTSFWNMYTQCEWLAQEIQSDPLLEGGFDMICHSQGGLAGRYYVQRHNNPQVKTYISWGTPHMGVCGIPGNYDERFFWLNMLKAYAYQVLYVPFFQKFVSFAGYWHDPVQNEQYLAKCRFLPYLNNQKRHALFDMFKENICKLENMVLIESYNEEIVEPSESCHFGYYVPGTYGIVESLLDSEYYKKDPLGLRVLYESDRLHFRFAHCHHLDFQKNEQNFVENTLPFLINANEVPQR